MAFESNRDYTDHPGEYFDEVKVFKKFRKRASGCECQAAYVQNCAECGHAIDCEEATWECDDDCHAESMEDGDEFSDCKTSAREKCPDCSHAADCSNGADWCDHEIHLGLLESINAAVQKPEPGPLKIPALALEKNEYPARHMARWGFKEDLALRSEYLAGEEIGEIVAKHERTTGSIRARLVGLCFPRFSAANTDESDSPSKHGMPWTQEEDMAIRQAWTAGEGIQEIAKAQQRKPFSVAERLIKLRVPEPLTEEELNERHSTKPSRGSELGGVSILERGQILGLLLGGADLVLIAAILKKPVAEIVGVLAAQGLIADSDLNLLTPAVRKSLELKEKEQS